MTTELQAPNAEQRTRRNIMKVGAIFVPVVLARIKPRMRWGISRAASSATSPPSSGLASAGYGTTKVSRTTRRAVFREIVRWLVMNCFPTLGFLLSASATSLPLLAPYRPSPTSPPSFLRVRSRATRPTNRPYKLAKVMDDVEPETP